MEFDIATINNYVSLCNFNDKRQGRATLIDSFQVDKWGFSLRGKVEYKHLYHLSDRHIHIMPMRKYTPINTTCSCGENHGPSENFKFHVQEFNEENAILRKLFEVTNNNMSLCGGSVLCNMLKRGDPNDYDFFFHCDSVSKADDLLKLCMQVIEDNYKDSNMIINYSRSQGAQTVAILDQNDPTLTVKLQFIRRNYQHKDQILLGFDLPCCQYGYNLIDGFFTTISGGMAYALGIFPLDLTQRSLSFGFRLRKYIKKGFVILLPGIKDFKEELETSDGKLVGWGDKRLNLEPYEHKNVYWNSEISGETQKVSDYDGEPQNNWYYIATDKKYNVTFTADTWKELYDMPEDTIRKRMFNGSWYYYYNIDPNDIKLKHAALFLGDKIGEYIMAAVQNKKKECTKIWKNKIKDYEDKAVEIYKEISANSWRFENPGSQSFGKNNPIITNPREWYGKDYNQTIVGISDDRIIAFYSCFTNWPGEIIHLLCSWWLIAEVTDANNYLFKFEAEASPVITITFFEDDSDDRRSDEY